MQHIKSITQWAHNKDFYQIEFDDGHTISMVLQSWNLNFGKDFKIEFRDRSFNPQSIPRGTVKDPFIAGPVLTEGDFSHGEPRAESNLDKQVNYKCTCDYDSVIRIKGCQCGGN